MPWSAPGVHVLFADGCGEWKFLQRVRAGEQIQWQDHGPVVERTLFHQQTVKGDLGAVRPGPLSIKSVKNFKPTGRTAREQRSTTILSRPVRMPSIAHGMRPASGSTFTLLVRVAAVEA